jgi:hypothetical protein
MQPNPMDETSGPLVPNLRVFIVFLLVVFAAAFVEASVAGRSPIEGRCG